MNEERPKPAVPQDIDSMSPRQAWNAAQKGPRIEAVCHHPNMPRGWWCSRNAGHDGPCAARPRWWMRAYLAAQGRRV